MSDTIYIKALDRTFDLDHWNTVTHNGKFRTNQLAQHQEISNKIFDLLVKYKNSNNPLSKVLVLMKKKDSMFERRVFKGFMKDLTDDEITELRKEFFIYHDSGGHIRSERYTDPEENHKRTYLRNGIPSFYIVQGNNGDSYSRHNITTWEHPNDIETDVNKETYKAICVELFINGFGNYDEYNDDDKIFYYYKLYDSSDERFTQYNKVLFIEIFSNLNNNEMLPELFVYTNEEGNEILELINWMSYGRGPLGFERGSGDIKLNKVPIELKDKWLYNLKQVSAVKWPNYPDMKKEGTVYLFPGQKIASRDSLQIFGSNEKQKKEQKKEQKKDKFKPKLGDMLISLVNNIPLKNVDVDPEYQQFMSDLMKQEKTKTRDNIEIRALQKLYHDFGPSTFPKLLLLEDLQDAGYNDMYKKAEYGDYDF